MVVLLLAVSCGKEQIIPSIPAQEAPSGASYLFDDTVLPQLRISLSEQEWERLLAAYDADSHNHTFVKCSTVVLDRGDASYEVKDAGIRLRGQTSRRRPEDPAGKLLFPQDPEPPCNRPECPAGSLSHWSSLSVFS